MGWSGGRLFTIYWSVQLYKTRLGAIKVDKMGRGCRCRLWEGGWRSNELVGALVKVEFREGWGSECRLWELQANCMGRPVEVNMERPILVSYWLASEQRPCQVTTLVLRLQLPANSWH